MSLRPLRSLPCPLALAALLTVAGGLHGQAQPGTACEGEEASAFDFWIGTWDVFQADGSRAGSNTIEEILGGCVLHESYSTPAGYTGESFNVYDRSRGVWHQTWVDAAGALLVLEGGYEDDRMRMQGETVREGDRTLHRITWSRIDDDPDRVRQLWESSQDAGATWSVAFDGTYVRREP